jgi:glycosyltransferase involved in cell wall biosynthesis
MDVHIKKKIMFVIISLVGGGAEKVMIDIIRSIDPSRYEIELAVFEKKGVYLPMLPAHVRVCDLHKKSRYDFPWLIIRLASLLRQVKPDVVVSFMSYTNLIVVLAHLLSHGKAKIVIAEHVHLSTQLRRARLKYLKGFLYGVFYNFSDTCIVPTDGIREDLIRSFHVKADKIKNIYNPVDLVRIRQLKNESLGVFPVTAEKYIVAVGRLTWEKGYTYLLKAYSLICPEIEEQLLFLGEGEERKTLAALAKDLGLEKKVHFAGFYNNPYKFMKNASLFVLSSVTESFALVIVEAMASGVAVVATDCPSGPAEIISDGVNGILVPPADEKKLAEAMLRLLKDPALRNRLIANGIKRAESFGIPRIVPSYEALF